MRIGIFSIEITAFLSLQKRIIAEIKWSNGAEDLTIMENHRLLFPLSDKTVKQIFRVFIREWAPTEIQIDQTLESLLY